MGESYGLNRNVNKMAQAIDSLAESGLLVSRVTGTSTGGLSLTVKSTSGFWSLDQLKLHLSAVGGAGSLQVKVDSGTNAVYDSVLLVEPLTTVTDVFWLPERPIAFSAVDEVDITWESPTTGSAVTFGLEVFYKALRG